MTRVLITGGAGFLGTQVTKRLLGEAVEIFVSDVRQPASPLPGVQYVTLDVTDRDAVFAALESMKVDTVVHLAAIMTPGVNVDFEYRVDVEGATNVFDAAAATGVKKVVVSSSGAAYGYHADAPPLITEAEPVRGNPEYSYANHKRLVEEKLAVLRGSHPEMGQTIFRIGTILGADVKNQITALWDGKRILKIAGTESPFVFIWVEDVAEVMALAALGGPDGAFNVAGDGSLGVTKIAKRLNKPLLVVPAWVLTGALAIGRVLKLTSHGPEKVRFLRYRPVLDNTRLKTVFGYVPQKTSAEAFEAYIATHPDVVAG